MISKGGAKDRFLSKCRLSDVSGDTWTENGRVTREGIHMAKLMIDQFKKKGYTLDRFVDLIKRQNRLEDDDAFIVYVRKNWDTI